LYIATLSADGVDKVVGTAQLQASWTHLVGANTGEKITGRPNIFLSNLAVEEQFRGQGVCTAIFKYMLDEG